MSRAWRAAPAQIVSWLAQNLEQFVQKRANFVFFCIKFEVWVKNMSLNNPLCLLTAIKSGVLGFYCKIGLSKFCAKFANANLPAQKIWHLGTLPERSLSGFWDGGCPQDTSRKLRINFQIFTCPGNSPSPMCLQSVIMESKRTLEVPDRSLGSF